MWFEFVQALAVALVVLYGPGYLFFRGIRLSRILAVCCAPLYTTCLYAGIAIAFDKLGIPCNPLTVVGPATVLAALIYAISRLRKGAGKYVELSHVPPLELAHRTRGARTIPFDLVVPALFVLAATLVCILVFLRILPGANAFAPRYDNQAHLNFARAFLDSGTWSSLSAGAFLDSSDNAISRAVGEGFYPSAWTCHVVLVCMTTGVDLMVAINAVIAATASIVFPLGMYAFFRALLPHRRRAVALGVIAITGFANWPWHYILTGPLYPNQFGISIQFAAMAALIVYLECKALKQHLVSFAAFSVVSFLALALAHPTTIFSAYVFMACYGAHRIVSTYRGRRRYALLAGYVGCVVAFWVLCYHLPMLGSVIGYVELEQTGLEEALVDLVGMRFAFTEAQVGIVLCALTGCVAAIRQRDRRWLLLPVAFFAIGYIATRIDWWFAKHWIAALWYSDRRRMAINMTLYLMPIVAIGLDALLPRQADRSIHMRATHLRTAAACALVALVYVPCIPVPLLNTYLQSPLSMASERLENRYRETIYAPDEVAFVNRACEVIPKDALVINAPGDGSMWAYGVNGLNTYYRGIDCGGLTNDADVIRLHLAEYATEPSVREAVHNTGASYVLLLDKGVAHEDGSWIYQFGEDQMSEWAGINALDDDTPGFETVLAEGDEMRLYRIV